MCSCMWACTKPCVPVLVVWARHVTMIWPTLVLALLAEHCMHVRAQHRRAIASLFMELRIAQLHGMH